jgi:hypothetical protein
LAGEALDKLRRGDDEEQPINQHQRQEKYDKGVAIDPTISTVIVPEMVDPTSKSPLHTRHAPNELEIPPKTAGTAKDIHIHSVPGASSDGHEVFDTTIIQESIVTTNRMNKRAIPNNRGGTMGGINNSTGAGGVDSIQERVPSPMPTIGPKGASQKTPPKAAAAAAPPPPTTTTTTNKWGERDSKYLYDNALWCILQNQWPILNDVASTIHKALTGLVALSSSSSSSVQASVESDRGGTDLDRESRFNDELAAGPAHSPTHPSTTNDWLDKEPSLIARYKEQNSTLNVSVKEIQTIAKERSTHRLQEQEGISESLRRCLDEEYQRRSMLEMKLEEATHSTYSLQSQWDERGRKEGSIVTSNSELKDRIERNLRRLNRKNRSRVRRRNEINILQQENDILQLKMANALRCRRRRRRRVDEAGTSNDVGRIQRSVLPDTSCPEHGWTVPRNEGNTNVGRFPVGYSSSRQARRRIKAESLHNTHVGVDVPFSTSDDDEKDTTSSNTASKSIEIRSIAVPAAGRKRRRGSLRLIEVDSNLPDGVVPSNRLEMGQQQSKAKPEN